jgi:hypothetical protein
MAHNLFGERFAGIVVLHGMVLALCLKTGLLLKKRFL